MMFGRKPHQSWWVRSSWALVRVLAGWHQRLAVMCSIQTFTLLRLSSILGNVSSFVLILSVYSVVVVWMEGVQNLVSW